MIAERHDYAFPFRIDAGVAPGAAARLRAPRRPDRPPAAAHQSRRARRPAGVRLRAARAGLRRQLRGARGDRADARAAGARRAGSPSTSTCARVEVTADEAASSPCRGRVRRSSHDAAATRRVELRVSVMTASTAARPAARLASSARSTASTSSRSPTPPRPTLRVHFLNATPDAGALRGADHRGDDHAAARRSRPSRSLPSTTVDLEHRRRGPARRRRCSVAAPGDFSTYTLTLVDAAPRPRPVFDHVRVHVQGRLPVDDRLRGRAVARARRRPTPRRRSTTSPRTSTASAARCSDFSALRYPAWQERSEADFGVMFMEALAARRRRPQLPAGPRRRARRRWRPRRSAARSSGSPAWSTTSRASPRRRRRRSSSRWSPTARSRAASWSSALAPDGSPSSSRPGPGSPTSGCTTRTSAWNEMPRVLVRRRAALPPGRRDRALRRAPGGAADARASALLVEEARRHPASRRGGRSSSSPRTPSTMSTRCSDRPGGTAVDAHHLARRGRAAVRARPRADDGARQPRPGDPRSPPRRALRHHDGTGRRCPVRPAPSCAPGPNGSPQFLHTLAHAPLAWLDRGRSPASVPQPEIAVTEAATGRVVLPPQPALGQAVRAGLHARSGALPAARRRELGASEYDGDDGDTLRFGDGERGAVPADGRDFAVTYRVGGGARGNVAADALDAHRPGDRDGARHRERLEPAAGATAAGRGDGRRRCASSPRRRSGACSTAPSAPRTTTVPSSASCRGCSAPARASATRGAG